VLKVGHHGSLSSTTQDFLDAVSPTIAVISCGEGNKYGHPLPQILERLEKKGIKIYRTDVDGSIVLRTDGKEFTVVKPVE
jgi:competence protein ComEC